MATTKLPYQLLKDGTDGELITWDASGVISTVAVGTSGQVLTSNGAGAAPTFQAAAGGGGGDFVLLGSASASNSTSLDVGSGLDLNATIDTTYDIYALHGHELIPQTDGADPYIRFGDTGGFDSGASDYGFALSSAGIGGGSVEFRTSSSAAQIEIFHQDGWGNAAAESASFTLFFSGAGGTNKSRIWGEVNADAITTSYTTVVNGRRNSAITLDRVQLLMSTGNITSGDLYLYGINIT